MNCNKLKIFIFISNLDSGGAQRTTLNLANSWSRLGHEVHLTVGTKSANLPTINYKLEKNVKVSFFNKKRTLQCLFGLYKVVKNKFYDIVFSPSPEASTVLYFAAKLARYKGKIILRESNFRSYSPKKNNIRLLFTKHAYRNCSNVVSLSFGVKKDLIDRFNISANKIKVIHNPIDVKKISSEMIKKGDICEHYPKIKKMFKIIAVGRLVNQKGFDILIRAFNKIKDFNMFITIIGEGSEKANLRNQIYKYNLEKNIKMVGFLPNPYATMHSSDLFILPSRWEGFGHVIVEAFVCKLPVLAFDCKSGPSEIIKNFHNGILCKPEDHNNLADNMKLLAKNKKLRDQISKNGANSLCNFDNKLIAEKYIKLFHN